MADRARPGEIYLTRSEVAGAVWKLGRAKRWPVRRRVLSTLRAWRDGHVRINTGE